MIFHKIPQRRLIYYILLLALVPHFFLITHFFAKKEELERLQQEATRLEKALYLQQQKQALNHAIAARYKGDKVRGREEQIEALLTAKFIEGQMEKVGSFQEVPVQLAAPLQINTTELKQLLSLLEERTIPPYEKHALPALCLITDIRLDRTEADEKQQLILHLKMLKREFS